MIDDSGDRKGGTATTHVGRQWLGRLGKTDNGIVMVTTAWTDGRVHYPLHAPLYTPARRFARGRADPAFRTKPQPTAALVVRGKGIDEVTGGHGIDLYCRIRRTAGSCRCPGPSGC
ncbi:transposase [Streptomyces sp. NPDC021080]|uniref:transposase n=1 Tax=Streptomyces sp. NPDC021080 TaxID=3365110 RepID=UPI00378B9989